MPGHEEPNGKAYDLHLSAELMDLVNHLLSHCGEERDQFLMLTLVKGLVDIASVSGLVCINMHTVEYLTEHGHEMGLNVHDWRGRHHN